MDSNKRFQIYLCQEFSMRARNKSSYSLRAFARYLDIDPPTLSKIMNGKKSVGERLKARLLTRLNGNTDMLPTFVEPKGASSSYRYPSDAEFYVLAEREAEVMSTWYAYAILEMIEQADGHANIASMAQLLELNIKEVANAVAAMEEVGILKRLMDGRFADKTQGRTTLISAESSSRVRREHQKSLIRKSLEAVDFVPFEARDHSSMTFSMSEEDLSEAREMLKDFRRRFARRFSRCSGDNRVYNLSLGLFPLTRKDNLS